MKTGIRIGNKINKKSTKYLIEIISSVFKVGRETQMDQATIVKALDVIGKVSECNNTMVSHCNVHEAGEKIVNMDNEEKNNA